MRTYAGRQLVPFLWWSLVWPGRDANSRPSVWEADTLTTKPTRHGPLYNIKIWHVFSLTKIYPSCCDSLWIWLTNFDLWPPVHVMTREGKSELQSVKKLLKSEFAPLVILIKANFRYSINSILISTQIWMITFSLVSKIINKLNKHNYKLTEHRWYLWNTRSCITYRFTILKSVYVQCSISYVGLT